MISVFYLVLNSMCEPADIAKWRNLNRDSVGVGYHSVGRGYTPMCIVFNVDGMSEVKKSWHWRTSSEAKYYDWMKYMFFVFWYIVGGSQNR